MKKWVMGHEKKLREDLVKTEEKIQLLYEGNSIGIFSYEDKKTLKYLESKRSRCSKRRK
jgi:hypothetical protein